MRILHISDTHLGMHLHVRGAPAGWQRAHDHQRALDTLLSDERLSKVDVVVHTGDVFNRSKPPWAAVRAAAATWHRVAKQVPVVVMPGNHDRHGLRRTFPLHLPGVHVVHGAGSVDVAGVRFAVVAYQRRASDWARRARHAWGDGADLLLAHQAFDGARVPGLRFTVGKQADTIGPAHLPQGVRHILCGHIHPRQVVQVGHAAVVQPGSTARTSFGEGAQTKGACLWDLGRQVRWSFVDQPDRRWLRISQHSQVAAVQLGDLVRVARGPRSASIEASVRERGGWLVGQPAELRVPRTRPNGQQLSLLG